MRIRAACLSVCFRVYIKVTKRLKLRVCDLSHKMSHSNRAFQRTVIFLEKRRNAVPNNAEMSRLTNARRVGDISFTKNNTDTEIGDILVRTFPSLAGKDLSG